MKKIILRLAELIVNLIICGSILLIVGVLVEYFNLDKIDALILGWPVGMFLSFIIGIVQNHFKQKEKS